MDHDDIVKNSRFAGNVQRYHTWPTINQQSVAEHTWQMLRIWFHMWGPPPPDVTVVIVFHDAGEVLAGDRPFMAKRRSPELKAILDKLEDEAVEEMGGPKAGLRLTPYDTLRIKFCDWLEMMEFGLVEMAMGNNLCQPVVNACSELIYSKIAQLSDEDRAALNNYMQRIYLTADAYGVRIAPLKEVLKPQPIQEKAA